MAYSHRLTDDEKRELLRIARATLKEYLRTGRIPPGKPHRASLTENAGVFVSLHHGDQLRGCIGTQNEDKPLYKTIQEMAIAAARRDPRFAPVEADEMNELTIEISVLGDRKHIREVGEVQVGEHGLYLEYGGRRGLLLPQVAVDHEWDAPTFLARVCTKAGLPEDTWGHDRASLEVFTAQVFDEHTHPMPGPASTPA
jgi:hypothetical protein